MVADPVSGPELLARRASDREMQTSGRDKARVASFLIYGQAAHRCAASLCFVTLGIASLVVPSTPLMLVISHSEWDYPVQQITKFDASYRDGSYAFTTTTPSLKPQMCPPSNSTGRIG